MHSEKRMWSWRGGIHFGFSRGPVFISIIKQPEQLIDWFDGNAFETFDKDTSLRTFLEIFLIIALPVEEIKNILVVYLDEAGLNYVSSCFRGLNSGDDVVESSRDNALPLWIFVVAHHCESFTCARLPIREDGAVEAIQGILDDREAAGLVDLVLFGLYPEYVVEDEIFDLVGTFFDAENIVLGLHAQRGGHICLSLVKRPHSESHFDRLVLVLFHVFLIIFTKDIQFLKM